MTSRLVEQIRKHSPGTLQNRLSAICTECAPNEGGDLINSVKTIGDHTAGLVTVMATLGFVDFDKALPVLGHSTQHVRKGKTLVFLPETGSIDKIPNVIEPGKTRLLKD